MRSLVKLQPAKSVPALKWPWPLPEDVTFTICCIAGREASASLRIALGKRQSASAPKKATFYEAFTYWDWHGISIDDRSAREKCQRFWEYRRGFHFDGKIFGYPTPKERWNIFKQQIEKYPKREEWVEKIAVAHWMRREDVLWIAKHLKHLKGLDLSDIQLEHDLDDDIWSNYLTPTSEEGVRLPKDLVDLFQNLRWLGLPDPRTSSLISTVLPECTTLQTLSIRGRYTKETKHHIPKKESNLSSFIDPISKFTPNTVTALELRLSFLDLDRLSQALKENNSSILHIGIDVGAYIQVYTDQSSSKLGVCEKDLEAAAHVFALKERQDAYEEEHNKTYPTKCRWWLPDSEYDGIDKSNTTGIDLEADASEPGFEEGEVAVDNLTGMLCELYERATVDADFSFYPLTPERQVKSADPFSPLAFFTSISAEKTFSGPSYESQLSKTYAWLHKVFNWRPTFDWNSLMRDDIDRKGPVLTAIEANIQLMKGAGIPIHVLIGRHQHDESNLYWGSRYNTDTWSQSLQEKFDCNLGLVAPLINTLSIIYDLDNPLGKDHRERIDTLEPSPLPTTICPRMVCPWKDTGKCPFEKQWERPIPPPKPRRLPMRSKFTAEPRPAKLQLPLANNDSIYLPGEYADLNASEFSIDDEDDWPATLHHLARLTPYKREAVNWQRFWGEYASSFTALMKLDLRMPSCFDKVGSVKLAKILKPELGWTLTTYADERKHIQAERTPDQSVMTKVWPAGIFVRRTWIHMGPAPNFQISADEIDTELTTATKLSSEHSETTVEKRDRELLDTAIERAEEAARSEAEREKELSEDRDYLQIQPNAHSPVDQGLTEIEQILKSREGQKTRSYAEQAWRQCMEGLINELENYGNEGGDFPVNISLQLSAEEKNTIASLLQRTKGNLKRRAQVFKPENVFAVHEKLGEASQKELKLVDYQQILADLKERKKVAERLSFYVSRQSQDVSSVDLPAPEVQPADQSSDTVKGEPITETKLYGVVEDTQNPEQKYHEDGDVPPPPPPQFIDKSERLDSKSPETPTREEDHDLMNDLFGAPPTPKYDDVHESSEHVQHHNLETIVAGGESDSVEKSHETSETQEAPQASDAAHNNIAKEQNISISLSSISQIEITPESTWASQVQAIPMTVDDLPALSSIPEPTAEVASPNEKSQIKELSSAPAEPEPSSSPVPLPKAPPKEPESSRKRKAITQDLENDLPPSRNTRSRTATPGSRHSTPNYKEVQDSESDEHLPRKRAKRTVKATVSKKGKSAKLEVIEGDDAEYTDHVSASKKVTKTRGKKRAADGEVEGAPVVKKKATRGKKNDQ